MDSVEDLLCPVCDKLAMNAVESGCCSRAFCNNCAYQIQGKQTECPSCNTHFTFRENKLIRRMISAIKVRCPNQQCEMLVPIGDLQNHSEYCVLTINKCRVCNQEYKNEDLYSHSIDKHPEEALKAMVDYHNNAKSKITNASSLASKLSGNGRSGGALIDPEAALKNRSGLMASLGTTPKYYCGGPLGYQCICCDGNCGTTNGENCLGCMELDLKYRGLPRGFLVNSDGVICKVDIIRRTVYCGILVSSYGDSRCVANDPCTSCYRLTKTLPRYKSLCEE